MAGARVAGSQHCAYDTRTHFGCRDGGPEVCSAQLWDSYADHRLPGPGTARFMAALGTATCPEKGLGAREGLKMVQSRRGGRWGWPPAPARGFPCLLSALPSPSAPFLHLSCSHSCFGSHHSDEYAERRAWASAPYSRGLLKEAACLFKEGSKAVFGDGCGACWYAEQQQGPLQDHGEERAFSVYLLFPMPARRCPAPEKRGGLVLCCPSNDERHLHGDVLPLRV